MKEDGPKTPQEIRGKYRNVPTSSEEFMERKREEVERENRVRFYAGQKVKVWSEQLPHIPPAKGEVLIASGVALGIMLNEAIGYYVPEGGLIVASGLPLTVQEDGRIVDLRNMEWKVEIIKAD